MTLDHPLPYRIAPQYSFEWPSRLVSLSDLDHEFVHPCIRFEWPSRSGRQISIFTYFLEKYNRVLQLPFLPVVEVKPGKKTFVPAEFLT